MAEDAIQTADNDNKKKPKGFWQSVWSGIKNWFRNLANGPKFLRRRQIIKLVSQSIEGQRLLKLANDNAIPIRVTPFKYEEETLGTVELQFGDSTVGVKVANSGDKIDMATTLHHELRHIEQQRERGTIEQGFFGSLRDARRQHVISLMEEADAFTAETLEAFRRDKAGQPEFLATMRANGGKVMKHVEKFLEKHPYESFADDAAFARSLFTHIMQGGIDHYSAEYFKDYAETFEKAKTLREFREMMQKDPRPPKDRTAHTLFDMYGGSFAGAGSLAALSPAFVEAQGAMVKKTLGLIESVAKNYNRITSKDYKSARKRILQNSTALQKQFNSKSQDDRPKVISGEELQQKLAKKMPALNSRG